MSSYYPRTKSSILTLLYHQLQKQNESLPPAVTDSEQLQGVVGRSCVLCYLIKDISNFLFLAITIPFITIVSSSQLSLSTSPFVFPFLTPTLMILTEASDCHGSGCWDFCFCFLFFLKLYKHISLLIPKEFCLKSICSSLLFLLPGAVHKTTEHSSVINQCQYL